MAGQTRRSGIDVDAAGFLRSLHTQAGLMVLRSEADLLRLAIDVQNRARELCPVDTGRLRSSISHSEPAHDSDGVYVLVGTNVDYAEFVEFGTSRQHPQPYLRPAIAEAVHAWPRIAS